MEDVKQRAMHQKTAAKRGGENALGGWSPEKNSKRQKTLAPADAVRPSEKEFERVVACQEGLS